MGELKWKFSMTPQHGPMWDMYEGDTLMAYARREADNGWGVRFRAINPTPDTEKIYIGGDTDPVNFMKTLLAMHTKEQS